MKKIKDISLDSLSENLDMRDPERVISPKISPASPLILDDISASNKTDVSLRVEQIISLDKKTGKHFDALEKRSVFSSFFRIKDINLKPKKPKVSVGVFLLGAQRYFRKIGIKGTGIMAMLFLCLALFLGILDKIIVENRVNAGYEKLINLRAGHLDLAGIKKNVNNARFDLLLSDVLFTPFKIFPGDKISSVKHVISAGRHLTRGLDDTLSLYSSVDKFIGEKSIKKVYFTQLLLNLYPKIADIRSSLETSLDHYRAISWLPSEDLEQKRLSGIKNIEQLQSYLDSLVTKFPEFLDLLGHNKRKRYLIVFQNADEIRPTGGFMGSMGLLEVFRGRVQLFQKKDVYAIEWDLKKADYERLPAPKGINELTEKFGLRDANYYANLQDSSNAIKFFTDNANIDLDGIVYINQNILLHLLELTGPIYFEPLDMEITADNFSEVMSLSVEAKTFKKGTLGTPKQVLFDFMEVFSHKLISQGNYFDYLQSLIHDVESRDIMMWSFNERGNEFLREMGMNGKIDYDSSLDHMYPVYTSLSGNKSDRYMLRGYTIDVQKKESSCDFLVQTQIKSSHNMSKQNRDFVQGFIDDYNLTSPKLFEIQGAARNRQFMRVILPSEAIITPQVDTDIVDYGRRKGIEFFLETPQQQSVFYNYSYTLPNPDCQPYSTSVYKQPGIPSYDVSLSINGTTHEYLGVEEDFYFQQRK